MKFEKEVFIGNDGRKYCIHCGYPLEFCICSLKDNEAIDYEDFED